MIAHDFTAFDESRPLTLEQIRAVERRMLMHAIHPQDGVYWWFVDPSDAHYYRCMRARARWKDYYRAVRILRSIRNGDGEMFKRFSGVWWNAELKGEYLTAMGAVRASKRKVKLP